MSECMSLLRSTDSGQSWKPAPAHQWTGSDLSAAALEGRPILVASYSGGLQISRDGGATFENNPAPSGRLAIYSVSKSVRIIISSDDGTYVYTLPGGLMTRVRGSSLQQASIALSATYPRSASYSPALAAGTDPSSGFAAVQKCDASLRCGETAIVLSKGDVPRLYLSPNFYKDGTVFAALASGGLFRSTDGGSHFSAVSLPQQAREIISTVQGITFTPDFDAQRGVGMVFVGRLTVNGDPKGQGEINGGVLGSIDGGSTWSKVGKSSPLDGGVTALAFAPEGVLVAAFIDMARGGRGGILYTVDFTTWHGAYPAALVDPSRQSMAGETREGANTLAPPREGRPSSAFGDRVLDAASLEHPSTKLGVRASYYVVLAAVGASAAAVALRRKTRMRRTLQG